MNWKPPNESEMAMEKRIDAQIRAKYNLDDFVNPQIQTPEEKEKVRLQAYADFAEGRISISQAKEMGINF
jgi:hypothetical protein